MKGYKMIRFVLIANVFAQFTFTACDKKDASAELIPKKEIAGCFSAMVTDIVIPQDIRAGKPFVVWVEFMKPTPCEILQGFRLQQSRNELHLEVCLLLSKDPCVTMIDMDEGEFTLMLPLAGNYMMRYKGAEGEESISIKVRP